MLRREDLTRGGKELRLGQRHPYNQLSTHQQLESKERAELQVE